MLADYLNAGELRADSNEEQLLSVFELGQPLAPLDQVRSGRVKLHVHP